MADPYAYENTHIIRNKFDIRDSDQLKFAERQISEEKGRQTLKSFEISYKGFKDIHRHLFGEIYQWAGYSRGEETPFENERITPMINLSKGDTVFAPPTFLERVTPKYFEEVKSSLDKAKASNTLDAERFAQVSAIHIADLNHAHPFREGNGRTMRLYLDNLAKAYGFDLKSREFDRDQWMDASIKTFNEGHQAMKALILEGLTINPRAKLRRHHAKK